MALPIQSFAGLDDWTQEQRNWYIASNVVMIADWGTTRNMSKRYGEGYHETNAFLGKYPSSSRIDSHFLTVIVANYLIADSLGKYRTEYRTWYLQGFVTVQGIMVANNLRMGLQIKF